GDGFGAKLKIAVRKPPYDSRHRGAIQRRFVRYGPQHGSIKPPVPACKFEIVLHALRIAGEKVFRRAAHIAFLMRCKSYKAANTAIGARSNPARNIECRCHRPPTY